MVRFLAKASWEMLLRQRCAFVRWESRDLLPPPSPAAAAPLHLLRCSQARCDTSVLNCTFLGKKAARAAVKSSASAWCRFLGAKSRSASHCAMTSATRPLPAPKTL